VIHPAASAGFDRSADAYDRARPDYPDAGVDWLWGALGLATGDRLVDVGAGTGKLTAPLAARGADVVAVEPVAAMRERLVAAVPTATAVDAAAEALPVADGSAAAVVAGQAFHWFANDGALAEFHRVLRPGGRLGLIWNRRRLDDPLQAAISGLLEPVRGDAPRYASDAWRDVFSHSDLFSSVAQHEVEFAQVLDRPGLVDRVGSTSFVAALDRAPREALLARVAALVDPDGVARLPYLCEAFAYARRDHQHGRRRAGHR
jgi:ubiquinone/menaquinone biosynthesis C-methylase UbiE